MLKIIPSDVDSEKYEYFHKMFAPSNSVDILKDDFIFYSDAGEA